MSDPETDLHVKIEILLDALANMVRQHCVPNDSPGKELDSMALSTNADAMRLLAEHGRFVIMRDTGRRVIGYWKKED